MVSEPIDSLEADCRRETTRKPREERDECFLHFSGSRGGAVFIHLFLFGAGFPGVSDCKCKMQCKRKYLEPRHCKEKTLFAG